MQPFRPRNMLQKVIHICFIIKHEVKRIYNSSSCIINESSAESALFKEPHCNLLLYGMVALSIGNTAGNFILKPNTILFRPPLLFPNSKIHRAADFVGLADFSRPKVWFVKNQQKFSCRKIFMAANRSR